MARFRVYAHPEASTPGYLLDLQADLLEHLNTCVVVPLLPADAAPKPAKVLNPVFEIEGARYIMATQFLATVPRRLLGPEVSDLQSVAGVITNALDCLFKGF